LDVTLISAAVTSPSYSRGFTIFGSKFSVFLGSLQAQLPLLLLWVSKASRPVLMVQEVMAVVLMIVVVVVVVVIVQYNSTYPDAACPDRKLSVSAWPFG
jgi:glucan phosphoethanolaminetransferase (alkaline phosphatase superfamily)